MRCRCIGCGSRTQLQVAFFDLFAARKDGGLFEQVAKFSKEDIDRVDDRLSFKGRIERDGWLAQAAELAKG